MALESFEIRPGLHRIEAPLGERFIAMHLFVGPDAVVLFDTGVAESIAGTLLPYLARIGVPAERITHVISSHCDFDHTGGNAALQAVAPHAAFLAGRADVAMTEDVEELIAGRYGEFRDADGFDDPPETTATVRASTGLVTVDTALDGGEVIALGDRDLRVVAVPGHSPGHLALWDEANRTVVISDAVLGETVPFADGRAAFPPTYRDTQPYLDSIEAVRTLDADLLLTAHYPVFEGAAATAFLDASAAYVARIDREIEAGLVGGDESTTLELIASIGARLGPWPAGAVEYLIFPVTGNLERLVERGAVAVGERAGIRTWRWVA